MLNINKARYAECHYSKCHCVECHGALMTAKTFDSVWSLAAVTLAGSEDAFFSSSLSSPYKIVKGMSWAGCATFKLHNKLEGLSLSNTSTAV
jgi:hypothetical protein